MVVPLLVLVMLASAPNPGAVAAPALLQAKTPAAPRSDIEARPLIVGSELDYPPFALVRKDGTADGFTVDLWRAVAQQAGLTYELRVGPFHEILRDFQDGKVDVLINLAQSDARKEFSEFSVPHVTIYGAIFVRDGDDRIQSEDDLRGKSLLVLRADLVHDYAVQQGLEKYLVPVDDTATAMRLLSSGQHDAVLVGKLVGLQTLRELRITNVKPVPARLRVSQKFSFAVRKGNSELLAQINEGLALTRADGTFDALYDKWFGLLNPHQVTLRDVLRLIAPYAIGGLLLFAVLGSAYVRQLQLSRQLESRTSSLRLSEAEIRRLNTDLESRVERRTAELVQANEELRRSNADWEQFAHVASHDLQEPLRQITSYAQLLSRRYKGQLDTDANEFIEFVVEGATRMSALVRGLREYARVGRAERPLVPTDCNAVLEGTLVHLCKLVQESGAEITHDALPTVAGDETQLEKLFQNLVGNALKFRGEQPPRVHISATRRELPDGRAEWVLAVKDNGIGIDPQYFERIFVIFQRLHTRTEYPGTGMGLALCKKIVERHGGHIWVESAPQQGATFFFTLPA